ncbi:RNA polymerase sigma-70 factor, ECF subfamily [Clostridium cavendishii DSM 21758]|uniref:RNA polymerase sigma-70 factor, ECF subfamily n=1 Tax=Clostridium cavendishii DSM 21758 TaxID=1121302 RepID=A0A1M6I8R9_9CLOT|nr:sigma-70 family RNA polymerase sigma factor [Clostridium cavendishii]SHJ30879.1 RNA polymerase sigma-70 factor, ECF subfamily [Clostridium cavendishii DSM 21758]
MFLNRKIDIDTKEKTIVDYVAQAIQGDKDAFCYLIRYFEKDMNAIAMCILKDEANVADAIGEGVLKAYKNINTLKNLNVFKSWLLKIIVNECNAILRKNSKLVVLDKNDFEFIECNDKYENLDIKRALENLSPKHKIIIELYYYQDMSVEEIGNILEISEGTVKSRLSRARQNLYQMLREV